MQTFDQGVSVQTVGGLLWFWGSSMVLAVMLFFPVSKFMWVISVRRFETKQKRKTTEEERDRIRKRSRMIAAFVVITFSFLFNRVFFHP